MNKKNKNDIISITESRPKLSDDFYGWVNHNWFKSNLIPEDETKYTNFIRIQNKINDELHNIIMSGECKLATTLFSSYIDLQYKNLYSISELKEIFKTVDNIRTYNDLIDATTDLLSINVSTLFNISVDLNMFDNTKYILYITQPTLGLPDREYYYNKKYFNIKQKYYDTICLSYKELYPNMSQKEINNIANDILDIEMKLSILFISSNDRRNIKNVYNQINYDQLIHKYEYLHFDKILENFCKLTKNVVKKQHFDKIILETNMDKKYDYFEQLRNILVEFSIDQWKEYFRFHIIIAYMNLTTENMRNIYFDMFKKTIRGQNKNKTLIKSAISFTCSLLYDPISYIYYNNYFIRQNETYVNEMFNIIQRVFKKRILKLNWMTNKTKSKALQKLNNMRINIGYSKKYHRNYEQIKMSNSLIKNTIILNKDNFVYYMNNLTINPNNDEWESPAFVVNAYYNHIKNEIKIPAGILQYPFIDINKSDVYNFSRIGTIISHEMTHGFDDVGSLYDENGSINKWWDENDKNKYIDKVNKIIKIYDDVGVNGQLTAGENIADFGAITLALRALLYKKKRYITKKDIQKFFIGYALNWQTLIRPEKVDELKLIDKHSLANIRVNIPIKHQKIFHIVFDIKKNDEMYINFNDILTIW